MGIVRRHPVVTLGLVVASLPLFGLVALDRAHDRTDCRRWQAQVASVTAARLDETRPAPYSLLSEGVSIEEVEAGVRKQVEWDLDESRPPFCR